ncbi:MAG: bifunctional 3-(3-hydroxy-phenyl)propionate/3-hydroxycinnamic acid hydroxylase [Brevundimonas sp.]|uniref:bifunctional 3-(3-hydroxy-phenyl)propionate/3-hydroxycinnamic acid hydroxylase n=1 Tax=Brevundimonas sp. TaxID=1871086 RepID=UPI0027246E36|nr:bifunctional 3-(3-hydroxy-phenyl)propionate/3-hydroxycinnamic acid hydroxylase [Brevundimonas sp.]MDO9607846.1 bifunctional 3-(3-hydroxy-phenyl)propionate/3-hydroxycinnamic acid hydroxylase [Brevundimonas sp.]
MTAAFAPDPTKIYDVLIIGGGPTGLTLANLLGRYGVNALLIERNRSTVQEPRAVSIDDESLRTLQSAGVIDAVLPDVVRGYGSEYYTARGSRFLKVEPTIAPYGYPRRNAFRQPLLEASLRECLTSHKRIETLFGWALKTLIEEDGVVEALVCDEDGQERTFKARFVVGADGASSTVRRLMGLSLDGDSFHERWLIVDLENSPSPSAETMVFCDTRRPCVALPGPHDTRRFEFKLMPHETAETMTDDAVVETLLASHGAAGSSRIVRKCVYGFHARLAARWSLGRVFLAGDACHLTPPFAGQGMNSGLRDAHNLAWKLAYAVRGILPVSLLDTYELERRDHVKLMIELALRMGRIMGPSSALNGFLTQSGFRLLNLWPAARDYFAQMKYKPAPRFAAGLLLADGRTAARTSVGRLSPQPQVRTARGDRLLDDVLGDGFALIGFGETAAVRKALTSSAFDRFAPRRILVTQGAPAEADDGVVSVNDAVGGLWNGLDAPEGRLFLVRPDRYVLGAFTPAEAERFVVRLDRLWPQSASDAPASDRLPAAA